MGNLIFFPSFSYNFWNKLKFLNNKSISPNLTWQKLGANPSMYILLSQWQNVLKYILLSASLNKHALLWIYPQELHLHGNSIGDEGIRSLMTGLASHKGKLVLFSDIDHAIYSSIMPLLYLEISDEQYMFSRETFTSRHWQQLINS